MYDVIKDCRDDKLYIDKAGSMIRVFEKIIEENITKESAKNKYPNAIDIETAFRNL